MYIRYCLGETDESDLLITNGSQNELLSRDDFKVLKKNSEGYFSSYQLQSRAILPF